MKLQEVKVEWGVSGSEGGTEREREREKDRKIER
jgi:hypothetical protein